MQDIEIGDKLFDDCAVVQSSEAAIICDFLTAPRRKHIKKALKTFKNITISNIGIKVVTKGMESSSNRLKSTVNSLCEIAKGICPLRDENHPIENS